MGDDIMKVRSIANPDFQVSKLERETLHDRAYLELKKAIMSGAIRPGATITIRAMATALGTSPMPVREALRRLVAERALEMLPTRSVTLPLMVASRRVGESASWGGPLGPALNTVVLRRLAPKITAPLLELDARSHASLSG